MIPPLIHRRAAYAAPPRGCARLRPDHPGAWHAARAEVDVLRVDKMPVDMLRETVATVRAMDARLCLAAAGGITLSNAADYAATGIDIIVTSALYAAKPVDIAARIAAADSP